MKTICILLLLGAVTYVVATPPPHRCDPLAANTYNKGNDASDKDDQVISLDTFSSVDKAIYYVTQASRSSVPGSDDFCNAATRGGQCGAVVYYRKITAHPEPGSKQGADKIRFTTIFVGASIKTGKAIEYHMQMRGIKEDDYIFTAVAGSELIAYEVDPAGERRLLNDYDIPTDIISILRSKYALYHSEPGSFNVYATCNGLYIWVAYSLNAIRSKAFEQFDPKLDKVLKELRTRAHEMNGKIKPQIYGVTTEINPKFIEKLPEVPTTSS